MTQSQKVTVNQIEHIRVRADKPFAEVMHHLETVTGLFDATQLKERARAGASPGAITKAFEAMAGESGFMRFAAWDHGAILRQVGHPADAVRFVIGHPLISVRMTKRVIGSGLYTPLSLLVAGDERGGTLLEYDRPSTLLKQFDDAGVTEVALELDEKMAALIRSVTGAGASAI